MQYYKEQNTTNYWAFEDDVTQSTVDEIATKNGVTLESVTQAEFDQAQQPSQADIEAGQKATSLSGAKSDIEKTNVAMTSDMVTLLTPNEKTAIETFRADALAVVVAGGIIGQADAPTPNADLDSAFAKFGIV